ncbi:unnamed protein product [Ceutorhynchus assimilis]|uniref:Uncharacterized protein n=1 Tax=Ceutorhynchus assimilis TaxID=467358 RepID=A0A9N9MP11_9CUCU|nr:unnamed protein product [Ceutorhynchus assimilis]
MDNDQSEQPRKYYKLRSSLKRQSQNPGGNLDVTNECQDATLQPPPRRVSFAASRNVKPFLDDPDNNTIWDHTYEEAIISNTDSNNVPSLDSQGKVQETISEMQKTIFDTDMEFTCVNDQDTIGNDTAMQKTIFETDMEFTCVNIQDTICNKTQMQKTIFETDMEFTCINNVQDTICNDAEMQKTIFETDMEFTCLSTNFTQNEEIKENIVAKATPAIFVDSTNNLSLEPQIPAITNKRTPFGQIHIAADSIMEESKTLDKLPSTRKSLQKATRSENLALGEPHKQFTRESINPPVENKTTQENAAPFKNPEIFVDSANELRLGSKTVVVEKGKDKRTPFGHVSIVANSKVEQSQTKVKQPRIESIHEAVNIELPNIDEELSIVDLHDKDCTNIFTPPKVIYSEPMRNKRCTSFLDFTTGLSLLSSAGKKQFPNSTLDGTQQLIEATFSKPNRNTSEIETLDISLALAEYSSLPLVEYKPVKFDYTSELEDIKEGQALQAKIRLQFEQESRSPKLQKSLLIEKVKRLSICNNNCISPKDQSTEDGVLLGDSLFDTSEESSKSLHEKIMDVFQNNEKQVIELHKFEENYYLCSAFSNLVWCSVKLHAADGTVEKMIVSEAIAVDWTKSAWPALYKLVASFIINKLQMDNLKSALGSNFDMLSLLDHIIIVTEKSSEFFVEFIETRLHNMKTLDVYDDGTVSFRIVLTDPPTIWTLSLKMASVESIQQDSLVATSRWNNTINQEKIKTILRNTEPGINCIKRFADAVIQYFMQTLNVPQVRFAIIFSKPEKLTVFFKLFLGY